MSLNELKLFKNVKITPDYSVVHDMVPATWSSYLTNPPNTDTDPPVTVFSQSVNYYRMPDVIRIEGNFDLIRQATYGFLRDPTAVTKPSFGYIFFFVKDVKLLKQHSNQVTAGGDVTVQDVCELSIEIDVWSSYGGMFELYDSYVERRHMPRWKNEGTELLPDWKPIYYPNAGQGVDGAMLLETDDDIIKKKRLYYHEGQADEAHIDIVGRSFIVNILDNNGQLKRIYCMDPVPYVDGPTVYDTGRTKPYLCLQDIMDGTFYTETGTTAEYVQSIICLPFNMLSYCLEYEDDNGTKYIHLDDSSILSNTYTKVNTSTRSYLVANTASVIDYSYELTMTVVSPDHDAAPVTPGDYIDDHEPMLYLSPARNRKIVTGTGGTVVDIPDILSFEGRTKMQLFMDLTSAVILVHQNKPSNDLVCSNTEGSLGVIDCATLPIYNSAWKSYVAINKVGDEIAYNAKQMQALANGAAGTASNAIMGGFVGGTLGAAANIITGIIGTGTAMYGNEEELRAKQVTIRNSPSNVKSGGSGLAAYKSDRIAPIYVTMKIDDQSFEKLRFMYYWYGYHVNRTFKGVIDLHTRSKFDYIKTNGAKVKGDLTAGAAQQIAAIFDNGVTIYHGTAGYLLIGTGTMKENDEV